MHIIARLYNDFPTKFGVPRQSGLCSRMESVIVFEKPYRVHEALRGIEAFSHLWLIWQFDRNERDSWSPTVRPPKLGGNRRIGVFATRSPFRPNPIGLTCVRLLRIEKRRDLGEVLIVSGADMVNGTPIYDIKPYIPYADAYPEATGGFAAEHQNERLNVVFPDPLLQLIDPEKRDALLESLSQNPVPAYRDDPERIYGMRYSDWNVRFRIEQETLTVIDVALQ